MTKRERQYTDWVKFWRKVKNYKPNPTLIKFSAPMEHYIQTGLVHRRIRVPDTMLKKMTAITKVVPEYFSVDKNLNVGTSPVAGPPVTITITKDNHYRP